MKVFTLAIIATLYQLFVDCCFAENFIPLYTLPTTSVKNQEKTGACWCYCTTSFLESELLRQGYDSIGLSEMYIVNKCFKEKGVHTIRWQDPAFFTEGGESHDVFWVMKNHGLVPRTIYSGLRYGLKHHNHGEMSDVLRNFLKTISFEDKLTPMWKDAYNSIVDAYLGETPDTFTYKGKLYTPQDFVKQAIPLNPDDYVELTSFTHHPFYSKFILEIPDNWLFYEAYNVPIDELETIVDSAIINGYSIVWGGDVTEDGFDFDLGMMVTDKKNITQDMRQEEFDNYKTTDDHGMHIVGIALRAAKLPKNKDYDKEDLFYYVKNSWGTNNTDSGYQYMSKAFFRYKTVEIILHKDAIPIEIRKKLGI